MPNIWTIVFLVVSGQGIFLSIFLFIKRGIYEVSNRILGGLLLLFSLSIIENVGYWTKALVVFPHLTNTTVGFIYMYAPLFYLFLLFRIDAKRNFKPLDFLHFLPFFIFQLRMLSYYKLDAEIKIYSLTNPDAYLPDFWSYFWQFIAVVSLIVYSFYSYRLLSQKANARSLGNYQKILYAFYSFSIFIILYFLLGTVLNFDVYIELDYLITLAISFFIYLIGYTSLINPTFIDPSIIRRKTSYKYEKSNLTKEESLSYINKAKKAMEAEKFYLEKKLKMADLAKVLSISANHLSQALNEHANMSFIEFVNSYRVEEAKKLLLNSEFDNLTMETIANESGFNNKTSFNVYFKKFTSLTPKQFKKNYRS